MVRRFIVTAIMLGIVLVGVNDAWRYIQAQQTLRDTTYTIARWAAENAPGMSREQVVARIVAMAAPSNVTVAMYGQTDNGIVVRTRKGVPGTIVLGPVINMASGKSFSEALSTTPTIEDYRQAGIK